MTQFKIPVIEYDSSRPGTAIEPPHPYFVVNDRQLVISMVRSILTVNPGQQSRKSLAEIVWPTLRFMLDWTHAPDLIVSTTFLKLFRDFSRTSKIGELAQGVSYAYWKWQRGYAWITDFGPWTAGLHPPYVGTKSPDFVMLNMTTNDLAVMESKGTGSDCHKKKMGEALRQCRAAIAHPAFARGFGSVLTFDSGNPSTPGQLHIRDPEKRAEITEELRYFIFRRSYASWFDLVGDNDLADWCRQEISDGVGLPITEERIDRASQDWFSPLRFLTAAALGFDPVRTSYELDPLVRAALADFNFFKRAEWGQFSAQMHEMPPDNHRHIRFPDGTIIIER